MRVITHGRVCTTLATFAIALFWLSTLAVPLSAQDTSSQRFQLWDATTPPDATTAPYLDRYTLVRVHRAEAGEYQFLHGPSIVEFKDTLFVSWANSLTDENSASETMRGRRSSDGGLTWSSLELIAPGFDGAERHSHGVFQERDGRLWIFSARFGIGEEKPFPGLHMEAFVLDETTNKWTSRGIVAGDFWPQDNPQRMENGSWIIPGCDATFRAAVAISRGDDFQRWETIKIPHPSNTHYSETTLWAETDGLTAIVRCKAPDESGFHSAGVSQSTDFGKTWTPIRASNFPMVSAKAAAGILTTGQRYLIGNSNIQENKRWPLTIAVGGPGQKRLCRMWRIRDGRTRQPVFPGQAKNPGWQYPDAYEFDGNLYVIYSVGKEDCELAIVPIESLAVESPATQGSSNGWTTGASVG